MIGQIVRMIPGKAFAFIGSGGTDYFFHRDDYEGHWQDLVYDFQIKGKITVKFEDVTGDKGPRAAKVSRV